MPRHLGRRDQQVTRDELAAHATALAAAVPLPLNVDAERCFADDPEGVTETVRIIGETGAAGISIEDFDPSSGIEPLEVATERVAAAVEGARASGMVLTARAENHIYGIDDLDDTIERLTAYRDAGADVLYAPGLRSPSDIEAVVTALDRPVNVLARPGGPTVSELGALGVRRVSTGGALARAGYAAMLAAARRAHRPGHVRVCAPRPRNRGPVEPPRVSRPLDPSAARDLMRPGVSPTPSLTSPGADHGGSRLGVQTTVAPRSPSLRGALGVATTPRRLRLFGGITAALAILFGLVGSNAVASRVTELHEARSATAQLVRLEGVRTAVVEADSLASSGYLSGGLEPPTQRAAYNARLAAAQKGVVAASGAATKSEATDLGRIGVALTAYSGLVEQARANNRQGFPVGAAYQRQASALVGSDILPDARPPDPQRRGSCP